MSIHTVVSTSVDPVEPARLRESEAPSLECDNDGPVLRPCQTDCLKACAKGARIIEMACGTGKTRVIKELVRNISGRAPCLFMWSVEEFGYALVDVALQNTPAEIPNSSSFPRPQCNPNRNATTIATGTASQIAPWPRTSN